MSKVAWKYYHKKYDGLKNDMKCKNSIANEHYDISLSDEQLYQQVVWSH